MHCLMQYLWNLRDGDIDDYQDYGFDQLLLNDVGMSFNIWRKKENHILKLASHEPWELCESQKNLFGSI